MMNWIIAIIVAIVYLTVSIIFKAWAYSWLIWVVYAIYRFIVKQTNVFIAGLMCTILGDDSPVKFIVNGSPNIKEM